MEASESFNWWLWLVKKEETIWNTLGEKRPRQKKKGGGKWNKNEEIVVGILNLSHNKHNTYVTLEVLQEAWSSKVL